MSLLVPDSVIVTAYGRFFEFDRSCRQQLLRLLGLERDFYLHLRLWVGESIRKLLDLFFEAINTALGPKELLLKVLHFLGLALVSQVGSADRSPAAGLPSLLQLFLACP